MVTAVKPAAGGKAIKRTLTLSAMELAAVRHVQAAHRLRTFTEGVRLCLMQQSYRDRLFGTPSTAPLRGPARGRVERRVVGGAVDADEYRAVSGRLHDRLKLGWGRSSGYDSVPDGDLQVWLGRFFPLDDEALQRIVADWGFLWLVNACRFCIRVQAELDGFPVPGGVWK